MSEQIDTGELREALDALRVRVAELEELQRREALGERIGMKSPKEQLMPNDRSKIGSAILGMFAAIKICRSEGYEPADVLRLIENKTDEWGLLPEKASGKKQSDNSENR